MSPPPPRSPRLTAVPDLAIEQALLRTGIDRVAGMDEVGRGALAGPVTVGVAVVTAGMGPWPAGLRDSKLLTPAARRALVDPLRAWLADYAVGHATAAEIDRVGIVAGLRLAGLRALAALRVGVGVVVLDGNVDFLRGDAGAGHVIDGFPPDDPAMTGPLPPVRLELKADLRCASVAAASILAKVSRDELMTGYASRHPGYGWETNVGYGSAAHRAAIAQLGPCAEHRRSWRLPPMRVDRNGGDGG